MYSQKENDEWGIPFHPTCFEIYRKKFRARTGGIDSEGLFSWHRVSLVFPGKILLSADYDMDQLDYNYDILCNRFVRNGSELCWRHEPGCEYLVANPIDIPGLQQLLEPPGSSASKRVVFGSSDWPDDSQMEDLRTPPSTPSAAQDIFSVLPAEITSIILDRLGPKDIANLRLATPVFRQLPTVLFQRLFWEEMPCLFEVKELDMAGVDWYELYCRCKIGCRNLKGLRNRDRIWRDVEKILDRIQKYREEGKISEL